MKAKKQQIIENTVKKRKTTTINEEAESRAIEEWLWMVDKPLGARTPDKKDIKIIDN